MCFHPKSVFLYYNDKSHNQLVKFRDYGALLTCYNKTNSCWMSYKFLQKIDIPCGHCAECAMKNARDWTTRLLLENYYSIDSWFFTLTYNDQNYTKSLLKDHLRQFIKAVRNYYYNSFKITNIRYYSVGEYGLKSGRSHYHIIFFNLPIKENLDKDLKLIDLGLSNGSRIWHCKKFDDLWNKGFVTIGSVTQESIGYVARYCNKKKMSYFTRDDYKKLGIEPEFSLMSKKPGLGFRYVEEHFDDLIQNNFSVYFNGQRYYLDRSTIRKYITDYDLKNKISYAKQLAGSVSSYNNKVSGISNEQRELIFKEKLKKLKRSI